MSENPAQPAPPALNTAIACKPMPVRSRVPLLATNQDATSGRIASHADGSRCEMGQQAVPLTRKTHCLPPNIEFRERHAELKYRSTRIVPLQAVAHGTIQATCRRQAPAPIDP